MVGIGRQKIDILKKAALENIGLTISSKQIILEAGLKHDNNTCTYTTKAINELIEEGHFVHRNPDGMWGIVVLSPFDKCSNTENQPAAPESSLELSKHEFKNQESRNQLLIKDAEVESPEALKTIIDSFATIQAGRKFTASLSLKSK